MLDVRELVVGSLLGSLLVTNAAAVDPNSGLEGARAWPASKTTLKVHGYVENGVVNDFAISNGKPGPKVPNKCFEGAPEDQPPNVKYAHTNFPSTPTGYNEIQAWMALTNDGTASGSVEVRSMELWTKDAAGKISLVSDGLFCKTCTTKESLVHGSMLQRKSEWGTPDSWALKCIDYSKYPETCTNPLLYELKWNNNTFGLFSIPTVVFKTSMYPDQVFHPWLSYWNPSEPEKHRFDAIPGSQYAVRVVAKVKGAARLQIGFDYYAVPNTTPICPPFDNRKSVICEGAVSNWQCAAPGWITVTAGNVGILQQ